VLAALVVGTAPTRAIAQSQSTWYLAEGATGDFDTEILIGNPHAEPVEIRITWVLPATTPAVAPTTFTMPPTSRKTVRIKNIAGLESTAVSAVVECTNDPPLDIVVERSMYWLHGSLPKGHNAPGVTAPATTWYLAEGATGDFRNFILIANPDPDPARVAQVTLTFLRDGGAPPVTRAMPGGVAGGERKTMFVNLDVPELAVASFSTRVESENGVPIIVERAMYFPSWAPAFPGPLGHESGGVTALSTRWIFGEGVTGGVAPNPIFDTFLLLANPGSTRARVKVTYAQEGGARFEQTVDIDPGLDMPPNSRKTIWVNLDIPGFANAAFSMEVESDVPILAERAVYWGDGTPATWREAHNSPGATAEATAWAFAEGLDGGFDMSGILYQSYFLVANTSTTTPLELKVTFVREDGTGLLKTYAGAEAVPPGSRFTFASWQFPELSNQRFATFIESTNGTAFVAERAVYWGIGFVGGHNSLGTPWTSPVATPGEMPLPSVLYITPNRGPISGGTPFTIVGNNLAFPATVTIGGQPAANVAVWNATTITGVTPPGDDGQQLVEVTSRGVTRTLQWFTYLLPAPPMVTRILYAVSPSYGGEPVTLEGQNFTSDTRVFFGGREAASVIFDQVVQLRVVTPPHPAGPSFVQVSNAVGTTATPAGSFTFLKRTATDRVLAFGDGITLGVTDCVVTDEVRTCGPPAGGYPSRLKTRLDQIYPAQVASIAVTNLGQSGERTAEGKLRLQGLLASPNTWDLVILMEGMEDVLNRVVYAAWNDVADMVTASQQAGKLVVLCTLTPVTIAPWNPHPTLVSDYNNAIRQLAAQRGVVLADFDAQFKNTPGFLSADGMHPTNFGYQLMAEYLAGLIETHFEDVWRPMP
jgi:lysophospholipase L1-like esterase